MGIFKSDKYFVEPHKQRVVLEANELGDKIERLQVFIKENQIFTTIEHTEQNRLIKQLYAMELYWNVLTERINNF